MAYAFYYDAPGTPAMYDLVSRELGPDRPEGLIIQVVTRIDAGLRHLNVWESPQLWEAYRDGRVRPAVAAVLDRVGAPAPDAPPQEFALDLIDVGPTDSFRT